jgi:predicted Zn-dependent protease
MQLFAREQALETAAALVRESEADETEVTLEHTVERFVRFDAHGPTQNADRARLEFAVRVRLASDGGLREARASVGGATLADGRRALARALELARLAPPNPELVELGGAVEVPKTTAALEALSHTFEDKAKWISSALQAARASELEPAGLIQSSALARAIVNSRGRAVYGQTARHGFSLSTSGGGGAGIAQASGASPKYVDHARLIAKSVARGAQSRNPIDLPPGEYTVVLEPLAVSAILLFTAYQGFGAREVDERSSFLCGREGQELWPSVLSIADEATHPLMPALAFDGEGTPRRRAVLVDRGRLGRPVTDRQFAKKRKEHSSGHSAPQPSSSGPMPQNMVVACGEQSLEQLIGGVERGLLISQFHYTNAIDSKELLLTGMTRNGTFLIENGRIRAPVKNLRFTQSLIEALEGLNGVGRDAEVAGALFDGEIVSPALRLERFRFTSATDF